MAQLVALWRRDAEVVGSSPITLTKHISEYDAAWSAFHEVKRGHFLVQNKRNYSANVGSVKAVGAIVTLILLKSKKHASRRFPSKYISSKFIIRMPLNNTSYIIA